MTAEWRGALSAAKLLGEILLPVLMLGKHAKDYMPLRGGEGVTNGQISAGRRRGIYVLAKEEGIWNSEFDERMQSAQ